MSTRSGKRIHSSIQDTTNPVDSAELTVVKNERRTRSKRKENLIDDCNGEATTRQNYVSYPGSLSDINGALVTLEKSRKIRKNANKNINNTIHSVNQDDQINVVCKTSGRLTRQAKKFNEFQEDDIGNVVLMDVSNKKYKKKKLSNGQLDINEEAGNDSANEKSKKGKKKKKSHSFEPNENAPEEQIAPAFPKKKAKKKKKIKSAVQQHNTTEKKNSTLNKSTLSVDSFHSAAGSPEGGRNRQNQDELIDEAISVACDILSSKVTEKINDQHAKMRKSSIKLDGAEQNDGEIPTEIIDTKTCNTTFEKENEKQPNRKRKSRLRDDFSNPQDHSFETFKHSSVAIDPTEHAATNISLDKEIEITESSVKKRRQSRRLSHLDPETPPTLMRQSNANKKLSDTKQQTMDSLDLTFEKKESKLDSTFEKNNVKLTVAKPDTTFDKSDDKSTSKSSLISSDSEMNGTYNKANDFSSISITSDESKGENIVNTTPVLIESSLDESQLEETPNNADTKGLLAPVTPLKREGTFTKDGPENTTSPLPKITSVTTDNGGPSSAEETLAKVSLNQTPDKQQSIGTPGSTPFPYSKKPSKETSLLNVTRSIEKGSRRSSLAECVPRTTKVMFCSPVDYPLPTTTKKMIVKSSMKGSNKSFVFNDSVGRSARKRSFTHEEGGAAAKRSRLADDMQMSVERLSRPRTASATGKLGSTTPAQAGTPTKPRTKLPNFAALHQREFDRMESLDECQRRRAKRARLLLTTTGGVTVLDRTSPKVNDSPRKSKESSLKKLPAKDATLTKQDERKDPAKKLEKNKNSTLKNMETIEKVEPKVLETTLPTLKSMSSGYTRFGFKMNIGINPFTVPPKESTTVVKSKEKKPNGFNTRATLPSLNGVTSVRKDTAKQIVMREKSFTSLSSKRDTKRTENRTIIKGVRTNRRFELQMKMRNIDG